MQNGYGGRQEQKIAYAPMTESEIEKDQIQQALRMDQQMQSRGGRKANDYEPLPVNERQRDMQMPSGLKNVGNSKYQPLGVLFLIIIFIKLAILRH